MSKVLKEPSTSEITRWVTVKPMLECERSVVQFTWAEAARKDREAAARIRILFM
jgi:hypothetical protein